MGLLELGLDLKPSLEGLCRRPRPLLAAVPPGAGQNVYSSSSQGIFQRPEPGRWGVVGEGDRVERALLSIILGQQRRILELERRVGVPPDPTRYEAPPSTELPPGQATLG